MNISKIQLEYQNPLILKLDGSIYKEVFEGLDKLLFKHASLKDPLSLDIRKWIGKIILAKNIPNNDVKGYAVKMIQELCYEILNKPKLNDFADELLNWVESTERLLNLPFHTKPLVVFEKNKKTPISTMDFLQSWYAKECYDNEKLDRELNEQDERLKILEELLKTSNEYFQEELLELENKKKEAEELNKQVHEAFEKQKVEFNEKFNEAEKKIDDLKRITEEQNEFQRQWKELTDRHEQEIMVLRRTLQQQIARCNELERQCKKKSKCSLM